MTDFWKIVWVFVSCALFFGKIGMPAAVVLFKFSFWKIFIVSNLGGFFGNIVFTYLSSAIIEWWEKVKINYFKNHKHPKIFNKTNRFIIKVKKRFGLWGIAFFTPILLSIPIGAFIAERFYKEKKKVIFALSVAVSFWSIALYFLYLFFYESTKSIL